MTRKPGLRARRRGVRRFAGIAAACVLAGAGAAEAPAALGTPSIQVVRPFSKTADALLGLTFADPAHGFAVGEHGLILSTSNGGVTWQKRSSGVDQTLSGVSFPAASTGFIVGSEGLVLATGDAGRTWERRPSGTTMRLRDVSFSDQMNGVAVGDEGTILATADAGMTWQTKVSLSHLGRLNSVKMLAPNRGFAASAGKLILQTTDGVNWDATKPGPIDYLYGLSLTGDKIGHVAGTKGNIVSTHDGGVTWQADRSKTNEAWQTISFADASRGVVAGTALLPLGGGASQQARVLGTTADGGKTWVIHHTGLGFLTASAFSGKSAYITGYGGLILKTTP